MIKDVKSYINTVGNRLSKAFSMEAFGTEEQLEFWELSAEHFSRKDVPIFSEIANWMDLLYRAPVHFVYKLQDENLVLDRRHVITKNILKKRVGGAPSQQQGEQEKEYVKNFEHQLQNLEDKMEVDDVFLEQGISSHAIGPCEHIPLFTKDAEFWGIYCVGPYTKSPEQITPKLSIVGRILSTWLIRLEESESNPQKDYREKVGGIISDLGSGKLNTAGLAQVLLRYVVHQQQTTAGAIIEFTSKGPSLITSTGFKGNLNKALEANDNIIAFDGEDPSLTTQGKGIISELGIEVQLVPFEGTDFKGIVLLEQAQDKAAQLSHKELGATFSDLLDYRQKNQDFSDQLMETYYQMLRLMEQKREKTKYHTLRMMAFVQRFGMFFGLEDDEMEIITKTAKLHDIGYVGALSVEPGKTIGGEIDHPIIGADLISQLAVNNDVVEGIRTHHEWINGNGTPGGLASEQIPWTGKIIGLFEYVVDFVESNADDQSRSDEEWIELLSKGLMQRADVEFDMVLIPTAIQLIQSMGWEACTSLGVQD